MPHWWQGHFGSTGGFFSSRTNIWLLTLSLVMASMIILSAVGYAHLEARTTKTETKAGETSDTITRVKTSITALAAPKPMVFHVDSSTLETGIVTGNPSLFTPFPSDNINIHNFFPSLVDVDTGIVYPTATAAVPGWTTYDRPVTLPPLSPGTYLFQARVSVLLLIKESADAPAFTNGFVTDSNPPYNPTPHVELLVRQGSTASSGTPVARYIEGGNPVLTGYAWRDDATITEVIQVTGSQNAVLSLAIQNLYGFTFIQPINGAELRFAIDAAATYATYVKITPLIS